jgi:phage repressor protein C with HTH and peptisase S24 domain
MAAAACDANSAEDLLVKRVSHNPAAGWLLVSDNPDKRAWPTRPFPDDAQMIGEVKWTGGSVT